MGWWVSKDPGFQTSNNCRLLRFEKNIHPKHGTTGCQNHVSILGRIDFICNFGKWMEFTHLFARFNCCCCWKLRNLRIFETPQVSETIPPGCSFIYVDNICSWKGRNLIHMLHVWYIYIYLHLSEAWTKCRWISHTWSIWDLVDSFVLFPHSARTSCWVSVIVAWPKLTLKNSQLQASRGGQPFGSI